MLAGGKDNFWVGSVPKVEKVAIIDVDGDGHQDVLAKITTGEDPQDSYYTVTLYYDGSSINISEPLKEISAGIGRFLLWRGSGKATEKDFPSWASNVVFSTDDLIQLPNGDEARICDIAYDIDLRTGAVLASSAYYISDIAEKCSDKNSAPLAVIRKISGEEELRKVEDKAVTMLRRRFHKELDLSRSGEIPDKAMKALKIWVQARVKDSLGQQMVITNVQTQLANLSYSYRMAHR